MMRMTARMMAGRSPLTVLPGITDVSDVGRPKKYRRGPDLVMRKERASVPIVEKMRRKGKWCKIRTRKVPTAMEICVPKTDFLAEIIISSHMVGRLGKNGTERSLNNFERILTFD